VIGRGVKEAVDKDGALGILTGGLGAAAGGISAALIFGFLFSVFMKSKRKRMGRPEKKKD
jgi:stage V sporulation protein AE